MRLRWIFNDRQQAPRGEARPNRQTDASFATVIKAYNKRIA